MTTSPLLFAERLGPATTQLMGEPGVLAEVEDTIRSGRTLEDAVLLAVHSRLQANSGPLAEEFLSFFLNKMLGMRATGLRPDLRRLLDTGDLVQSVARDFWLELTEFEFRSVGETMSWLANKLAWRTSTRQRGLLTSRRNESRRVPLEGGVATEPESRLPLNLAELSEDWNNTLVAMHRLHERDRELIEMMLEGHTSEQMSQATGRNPATTRRALSRALARLRVLMRNR